MELPKELLTVGDGKERITTTRDGYDGLKGINLGTPKR